MPQINQALRHFYRKNPESVELSLESIGDSSKNTKPTVLVVCTSVSKVKAILRRKLGALFDDAAGYGLKVCRGKVLRSRLEGTGHPESSDVTATANRAYQERPLNGASIGAWVGDRHLPPVSFGGLVVVDDKTYGMTVHHMLDDPDADHGATPAPPGSQPVQRSGAGARNDVPDLAAWYAEQYPDDSLPSSGSSSDSEDFAAEFSDMESEDAFTESAITSQYDDSEEDEEDEEPSEPGDIPGIEPGCGDGYIISQPALDDVEDGFFPSLDTQDEDHLDSFSLGEVFATSGIRRRDDERGLIHEIDWALFKFNDDRLPNANAMPRAHSTDGRPIHPSSVLPSTALPNLEVQCMARTSGLRTGLIMPALTSVKIYGRTSPSHTYQVTSSPTNHKTSDRDEKRAPQPLGLPGDSGAWIVERKNGQVCGHVLAFSQRKKVAYICPMDVLLLDIAEALEATEVKLPGGQPVVKLMGGHSGSSSEEYFESRLVEEDEDSDLDADLRSRAAAKRRSLRKGKGKPPLPPSAHDGFVQRAATMRIRPSDLAEVAVNSRPKSMDAFGNLNDITEDLDNLRLDHAQR